MQPKRIWWKEATASFKNRVEEIMPALCNHNSGQVTEGRDKTVGGSEIADCMFKVVMNKLTGGEGFAFTTLAKFFRGHRQEEFNAPVHRMISAEDGVYWAPQVRVVHREYPVLRAHVDNVYFVSPNGMLEMATDICVIEEKNAKVIPDEPHDNHVSQLQYQMALLKNNFPQAEVIGQIYGTDLNGKHTDFDLLATYQQAEAEHLFGRGVQIMEHVKNGTLPDPEPSLLCGFCPHIASCPKWVNPKQPPLSKEVQQATQRYTEIGVLEKKLDAEKKELKTQLVQTLTAQGRNWFKGQVDEGLFVHVSEMKGRSSFDKQFEVDHPDLAEKYKKVGHSYTTLKVIKRDSESDK